MSTPPWNACPLGPSPLPCFVPPDQAPRQGGRKEQGHRARKGHHSQHTHACCGQQPQLQNRKQGRLDAQAPASLREAPHAAFGGGPDNAPLFSAGSTSLQLYQLPACFPELQQSQLVHLEKKGVCVCVFPLHFNYSF